MTKLFVHYSAIQVQGYKRLVEGHDVSFEYFRATQAQAGEVNPADPELAPAAEEETTGI